MAAADLHRGSGPTLREEADDIEFPTGSVGAGDTVGEAT